MVDSSRTRTRTRSVALALLIFCLVGTPLATGTGVSDLRVSGPGVLADTGPNPTVAAWQLATVTASVDAGGTEAVCVRATTPDRTVSLGCHRAENGTASTTVDAWPANLSGRVTLVATPRPNGTGDRLEETVSLLRAGDDADDDGLTNRVELGRGTDPTDRDTDGDGIADGAEVERYGTDPTQPNTATTGEDTGVDLPLVGTVPAVPPSLLAVLLVGLLLGAVGVAFAVSVWSSRDDDPPPDTGDGGGDGDDPPPSDDVPAHPDAREVRALLDDNDGRLRQSETVERTDWSKSKVSRVLSAMADADQVRKIRVGRENLVVLPGAEPEHATGPFED